MPKRFTDIVRKTYGEIAVCKLAHSQKLAMRSRMMISTSFIEVNRALTVALMGVTLDTALIMAADTISGCIQGLLDGIAFKQAAYTLDRDSPKAVLARFLKRC
jgi:hypothetical protein